MNSEVSHRHGALGARTAEGRRTQLAVPSLLMLILIVSAPRMMTSSSLAHAEELTVTGSGRLSAITYKLAGKTHKAVAEVSPGIGDHATVRLFDDDLATYYTLRIASEDLLESHDLTIKESRKIRDDRGRLIEVARIESERRAAERRKRRMEELSETTIRGRTKGKSSRRKKWEKKGVTATQKVLLALEEEIVPLRRGLNALIEANDQRLTRVRSRSDKPARHLSTRMKSFRADLEEISLYLEKREGRFEKMVTRAENKDLSRRDAQALAQSLAGQLKRVGERLDEAYGNADRYSHLFAELPEPAELEAQARERELAVQASSSDTGRSPKGAAPAPGSGSSGSSPSPKATSPVRIMGGGARQASSETLVSEKIRKAAHEAEPRKKDSKKTSSPRSGSKKTSRRAPEDPSEAVPSDRPAGVAWKGVFLGGTFGVALIALLVAWMSRRRPTGFDFSEESP